MTESNSEKRSVVINLISLFFAGFFCGSTIQRWFNDRTVRSEDNRIEGSNKKDLVLDIQDFVRCKEKLEICIKAYPEAAQNYIKIKALVHEREISESELK